MSQMSSIRFSSFAYFFFFVFLRENVAIRIATENELRFIFMGDWGGDSFWPYYNEIESSVAKEMGIISDQFGSNFTVALGDNFYEFGVKSVDDKRFKETFEDIYTAKSLMNRWYILAGNHDHLGNVSAEIEYTQRSSRWYFPHFYYTEKFQTGDGSEDLLQLVMVDTVLLCGDTGRDYYYNQPKTPTVEDDDQWQWIDDTLKSSKARYLIVGGHYPVWSIAEHGPTWCLVNRLKPLLEKYNVTAYISGHDHNLQHLKEADSSVEYFVSGCGGRLENNRWHARDVPRDSSKFFWADSSHFGGFSLARVSHSNMTVTFIDAYGKVLYDRILYPRTMVKED